MVSVCIVFNQFSLDSAKPWIDYRLTIHWPKQWVIEVFDLIETYCHCEKVILIVWAEVIALTENFTIVWCNRWNDGVLESSLTRSQLVIPENYQLDLQRKECQEENQHDDSCDSATSSAILFPSIVVQLQGMPVEKIHGRALSAFLSATLFAHFL